MNDKAKEKQVAQIQTAAIPLPKSVKQEKRMVTAEVDLPLWKAVEKEMTREGLTIRQIVEFGLKSYLASSNPKVAAGLGITKS